MVSRSLNRSGLLVLWIIISSLIPPMYGRVNGQDSHDCKILYAETQATGSDEIELSLVLYDTASKSRVSVFPYDGRSDFLLSEDGRYIAFAQRGQPNNTMSVVEFDGNQLKPVLSLEEYSPSGWSSDSTRLLLRITGSNVAFFDVLNLIDGSISELPQDLLNIIEFEWAPSSEQIALIADTFPFPDDNGLFPLQLYVSSLETGEVTTISPPYLDLRSYEWLSEDRLVYTTCNEDLCESFVRVDEERLQLKTPLTAVFASPDGEKALVFDQAGDLLLLDAMQDYQTEYVELDNTLELVTNVNGVLLEWSPSSDAFAAVLRNSTSQTDEIWIYDEFGVEQQQLITFPLDTIQSIQWSPTGGMLLVRALEDIQGDEKVYTLSTSTGELVQHDDLSIARNLTWVCLKTQD
jgi:hypothetical protein